MDLDFVEGLRKTHALGGMKDNVLKPRVELIPTAPLLRASEVLAHGAETYAAWNWRKGMSWEDTYASALRHMLAWHDGEDLDPKTGLSHLAHAMCQIMFLIQFAETQTGDDDRWRPET